MSRSSDEFSKCNGKHHWIDLLRPTSKYFHHRTDPNHDDNHANHGAFDESGSSRLPLASRRLSLTIPVLTSTTTTTTAATAPDDDENNDSTKPSGSSSLSSSTRQIPIRLPQAATAVSTPSNHSRMSNPTLRPSPLTNLLQYPTTDVGDASLPSSSSLITHHPSPSSMELLRSSSNTSPLRRVEAMAREAILGTARLQQQQQQRSNTATVDGPNRSPSLSRRVIINLNNNQSVSLDSRLSSAMKPPSALSSSSRSLQRNNLYHVPVLHEIQMPSYPASRLSSASPSASNSKTGQYKNECHIEIPVMFATSNDQENRIEHLNGHDDEIFIREPISSIKPYPHQTLKSILKRSSSRDTVSRKNVSFMNA